MSPWAEIHCDTIGPRSTNLEDKEIKCKAMPIIDPVPILFELVVLVTKTTEAGAVTVEKSWLSCYP